MSGEVCLGLGEETCVCACPEVRVGSIFPSAEQQRMELRRNRISKVLKPARVCCVFIPNSEFVDILLEA